MLKTVKSLLDDVQAKIDTNSTEADMVEWINELERHLYRGELMESFTSYIDTKAGHMAYSLLTTDGTFEDVEVLIVDGIPYKKRTQFDDTEQFYTYSKDDVNIVLYPMPLTSKAKGIKIIGKKIPIEKTAALKETQNLTLLEDFGTEWADIYRNYCFRKACLANRDYTDANNYATLYNECEDEFWRWYQRRQPNKTAETRKRRWR